jgi:hypothetical protein
MVQTMIQMVTLMSIQKTTTRMTTMGRILPEAEAVAAVSSPN